MNKQVKEFVELYDLDALIKAASVPPLADDDVTVYRLVDRSGWHNKRAAREIAKWVSEGKMEYIGKRKHSGNGREVDAWRLVQKG